MTPSRTGAPCPTDEGAVYDAEVFLDANELEPFVTWGTNPARACRCPMPFRRPKTSPTPTIAPPPSARSSTWTSRPARR